MNEQHTIRRAKHGKENPYFLMLRQLAQDKRLSYEARGMMCYFLSKPDNWEVRVDDLILNADGELPIRAGKTKVYSILDELARWRYIRKPSRFQDAQGRWIWSAYEVYEEPYPDLPDTVSPDMDEPYTDKPVPANRDLLQSPESQNLESQIREPENPEAAGAAGQNIFELYEFAFGKLPSSALLIDDLKDMAREFALEDIAAAFKEAALHRATSPIKYARTILVRLKQEAERKAEIAELVTNGSGLMTPVPKGEYVPPVGQEREYKAWQMALGQLELQLDRATFETWLRRTDFLTTEWVDGGRVFVLRCENDFVRIQILHRLYRTMRRVLSDCYSEPVEFRCEVKT